MVCRPPRSLNHLTHDNADDSPNDHADDDALSGDNDSDDRRSLIEPTAFAGTYSPTRSLLSLPTRVTADETTYVAAHAFDIV